MRSDHDAQFSYQAQYMGELHVNMNDGSKATVGDQRRASHRMVVMPKAIDSTKLVERRDEVVRSQNTSNALSSSQVGKRF